MILVLRLKKKQKKKKGKVSKEEQAAFLAELRQAGSSKKNQGTAGPKARHRTRNAGKFPSLTAWAITPRLLSTRFLNPK